MADMNLTEWAVQKWRQDGIPSLRLQRLHSLTGIAIKKMRPDWPDAA